VNLTLLESVSDLLNLVKKETGKEVVIVKDSSLKSLVEAKTARKNDVNHIIKYSGKSSPDLNYIIATKAIQMLRIYRTLPEKRVFPVAFQNHLNNARMGIALEVDLKPHLKVVLNDHNLTATWILSLINQLTSQPVNINIEKEIYSNFPELRESQNRVISKQFTDFNMTLSKEVENLSPSIIYNSSAIMNYVYLKSIDDISGSEFISNLNYIVKRHKCDKLYEYTKNNLVDSVESDVLMIKYWADFFNMSQWFTWIDFEDLYKDSSDA